jgi:hypothetical protein
MKSRRMRWAYHVANMEDKRNIYKIVVRKPEEMKPLGKPKYTKRKKI